MHRDVYVVVAGLSGQAPLIYSTGSREQGAGGWEQGPEEQGS